MLGLITGIDSLGAGLAFAALLFPASLAAGLGSGVGVILLSSALLPLIIGLRSTQPNAIAVVQETSIAILASAIAGIAANMESQPEGVRVATAFAVLGTSTVVTGLLFLTMGRLKLGGLVRLLPYPVVAGFLAGSGWLLVQGAVMMLTDERELMDVLSRLADPLVLGKIIPAFTFAGVLILALRQFSHPMTASTMLVGSGMIFYVVLAVAGISHEQARAWTWLPSIPGDGSVSLPMPYRIVGDADWGQVITALPAIASAAVLNMVGLLLNSSGMELAFGREIDANAELRSSGMANLLVGVFGGPVGFADLSMTLLAEKVGAKDRRAGIATAIAVGIGLLCASSLASAMPSFLSAGLMVFLGLELLHEWAVESRHRLPLKEWLVVASILAAVIVVGFMAGLALGLGFSVVMFVYNYSRLPVVRLTASGTELRSSVDRSTEAARVLSQRGSSIYAIQLQGYLFFGSVEQIVNQVRQRLNAPNMLPLRFLLLDFKGVSGVDSAATSCFVKICSIVEQSDVKVAFSRLPDEARHAFQLAGISVDKDTLYPDIDHALEACEESLLNEEHFDSEGVVALTHHLGSVLGQHPRLHDMIAALEKLELAPGAVLIKAGDAADDLFMLGQGRIKVQVTLPNGQILRLRTMMSGAIVGEIAFYLGGKRTADVVVEEPSVIWRLSLSTLKRLEMQDAQLALLFHRLISITLAEKLVQANRLIQLSQ